MYGSDHLHFDLESQGLIVVKLTFESIQYIIYFFINKHVRNLTRLFIFSKIYLNENYDFFFVLNVSVMPWRPLLNFKYYRNNIDF